MAKQITGLCARPDLLAGGKGPLDWASLSARGFAVEAAAPAAGQVKQSISFPNVAGFGPRAKQVKRPLGGVVSAHSPHRLTCSLAKEAPRAAPPPWLLNDSGHQDGHGHRQPATHAPRMTADDGGCQHYRNRDVYRFTNKNQWSKTQY